LLWIYKQVPLLSADKAQIATFPDIPFRQASFVLVDVPTRAQYRSRDAAGKLAGSRRYPLTAIKVKSHSFDLTISKEFFDKNLFLSKPSSTHKQKPSFFESGRKYNHLFYSGFFV